MVTQLLCTDPKSIDFDYYHLGSCKLLLLFFRHRLHHYFKLIARVFVVKFYNLYKEMFYWIYLRIFFLVWKLFCSQKWKVLIQIFRNILSLSLHKISFLSALNSILCFIYRWRRLTIFYRFSYQWINYLYLPMNRIIYFLIYLFYSYLLYFIYLSRIFIIVNIITFLKPDILIYGWIYSFVV